MSELADKGIVQSKSLSSQDLIREGDRLFQRKQWAAAAEKYEKAVELKTGLVLAFLKFGKELLYPKRLNGSLRRFWS